MVKGFVEFIRRQGVVGFAVGFILGGAVSKLVSAVVTDVVNPLLGLLLGRVQNLELASIKLGSAVIMWGDLLGVFIDFIVLALVVYLLVHIFGFDRLDKKD